MDSYTVKKILPRLLVAVVAVQLSYFITGFLVDVFNILGNGIGSLMLAAGGGGTNVSLDFGTIGDVSGTVAILFGLANLGAILAALLPLFFAAILAILAVLFTLVFRQVIIAILIVLSPIAFVAWLLPNTEGFFKAWSNFFMKALMMYPLIVILLSSGQLVSEIVSGMLPNTGEGENALYSVVIIVVTIIPYFLIPFTFKFAGGALSAISGGLQSLRARASKPIYEASAKRFRDKRMESGQGGTLGSRGRGPIGRAVRWANAPYLGARGARGQEIKAATAIAKRADELGMALSNDEISALHLGAAGVAAEARRKRQEARRKRATGDLAGAAADEHSATSLEGAWGRVQGLHNNSIDRMAAGVAQAKSGFADEAATRASADMFGKEGFSQKLFESVQGSMRSEGKVKSAAAWGMTGVVREQELIKQSKNLSNEDLQGLKPADWEAFTTPVPGGAGGGSVFDQVLRAPVGDQDRDTLISKLQTILGDTSETNTKRRNDVMGLLNRNGIDIQALQPPVNQEDLNTYDASGNKI